MLEVTTSISFIHLFGIHYCYKITLGQVNDYT
jgi:hypothetical protein